MAHRMPNDLKIITAALALIASTVAMLFAYTTVASAQDDAACRDKFVKHFLARTKLTGVKIHITQEFKGAAATENWNYQLSPGHWMSETIKPAGLPWTLVHNNVMYTSGDKGKSWKKVRTLDSDQRADDVAATLKATVATIENVSCGSEKINGVEHEKLEADYVQAKYSSKHRETYWINPETGWMAKAKTKTTGKGYEMFVTQLIEPAPDLKLPTP